MPESDSTNIIMFLGRLHPAVVHLPIGFLIVLAVLEVVRWFKRFRGAAEARTVVLTLLVISSIAAVTFGLFLEEEGGYNKDLLFWHKWMGIGLAGACLATALAFWSKSRALVTLRTWKNAVTVGRRSAGVGRWRLGPTQEGVANPVRSGRKQRYRMSSCAVGRPSRHRRTPGSGVRG